MDSSNEIFFRRNIDCLWLIDDCFLVFFLDLNDLDDFDDEESSKLRKNEPILLSFLLFFVLLLYILDFALLE